MPFLLRPGPGREHFLLVGECYVDGLMGGEAVECVRNRMAMVGNMGLGDEREEGRMLEAEWVELR